MTEETRRYRLEQCGWDDPIEITEAIPGQRAVEIPVWLVEAYRDARERFEDYDDELIPYWNEFYKITHPERPIVLHPMAQQEADAEARFVAAKQNRDTDPAEYEAASTALRELRQARRRAGVGRYDDGGQLRKGWLP